MKPVLLAITPETGVVRRYAPKPVTGVRESGWATIQPWGPRIPLTPECFEALERFRLMGSLQ